MASTDPRPHGQKITLPQILALMAIWAAVIYGLTARPSPDAVQISLKEKPTVVACAPKS